MGVSSTVTLSEYIMSELSLIQKVVRNQLNFLEKLERPSLRRGLVTGAGDSHVASIFAQLVSKHNFLAVDPYELRLETPSISDGDLIAISVKGRTQEVIKAAETLRGRGWRIISVTANEESPLAKVSDVVIKLVYGGGALPVGIGNFAATLATLAWLFEDCRQPPESCEVKSEDHTLLEYEDIVTVGEGIGVVSAYFMCLKLHEVLCMPCRYYSIEQFLHAILYSLSPSSLVIIFPGKEREKSIQLSKILRVANIPRIYVNPSTTDTHLSLVLSEITWGLSAIMSTVRGRELKKPCFMNRKDLLVLSTPMIYGSESTFE